jgi:hypothetical protein
MMPHGSNGDLLAGPPPSPSPSPRRPVSQERFRQVFHLGSRGERARETKSFRDNFHFNLAEFKVLTVTSILTLPTSSIILTRFFPRPVCPEPLPSPPAITPGFVPLARPIGFLSRGYNARRNACIDDE